MRENRINRALRIIAAVGVFWVVLKGFPASITADSEQGVMWAFAFLTLVIVIAISFMFFRDEVVSLLRHTDLLIPIGLFVSANQVLRLLFPFPVASPLVTIDFEAGLIRWFPIHYEELLREMYILTASVIYAGWMMTLIIQLTEEGVLSLWRALKESIHRFWRTLVVLTIGWAVVIVMTQVVRINTRSLMAYAIFISVPCLCWNIITAPLLPIILIKRRRPLLRAIADGMRLGWRHWKLWLTPITLQYILLGGVNFFPSGLYSLESARRIFEGGGVSLQWSVNSIWTGAFANSFEWYSTALKTIGSESDLLTYIFLSVLFSIFAIIVKLRITQQLQGIQSFRNQLDERTDIVVEKAQMPNLLL